MKFTQDDVKKYWEIVTGNLKTGQRYGQAHFNALSVLNPEVAESIIGTPCDPVQENEPYGPILLAYIYKLKEFGVDLGTSMKK